jgi:hypothetical protein
VHMKPGTLFYFHYDAILQLTPYFFNRSLYQADGCELG